MKKVFTTLAKAFFIILFCIGFVGLFGEAETFAAQLGVSAGSMLLCYISAKALGRLGCFA